MRQVAAVGSPYPPSLERYWDRSGAHALGWLLWFEDCRAVWCGEITRDEFKSLPSSVRQALRDDLGWFLIEYDGRETGGAAFRVVAKIAHEADGLALAKALAHSRVGQAPTNFDINITRSVRLCAAEGALGRITAQHPAEQHYI